MSYLLPEIWDLVKKMDSVQVDIVRRGVYGGTPKDSFEALWRYTQPNMVKLFQLLEEREQASKIERNMTPTELAENYRLKEYCEVFNNRRWNKPYEFWMADSLETIDKPKKYIQRSRATVGASSMVCSTKNNGLIVIKPELVVEELLLKVAPKFYNMIRRGGKKEDYRQLGVKWANRLYCDINGGLLHFDRVRVQCTDKDTSKPDLLFEFKGVTLGRAEEDWAEGWEPFDLDHDRMFFIISLGMRLK